MTAPPIYNPVVPCVHPIPGGIYPGRMVRVHGEVPQDAQRFSINLQCGPKMEPQDDIALHMDFRFNRNYVVRNHFTNTTWGKEETHGKIPFSKGQTFEILLLCDPDAIKVAINGAHFCSFHHRMPAQCITHVAVYGGVCIQYIGLEGGAPPLETPPFSLPRDPPPPYSAVTGYGATQVIATQPAPASAPMTQDAENTNRCCPNCIPLQCSCSCPHRDCGCPQQCEGCCSLQNDRFGCCGLAVGVSLGLGVGLLAGCSCCLGAYGACMLL